MFVDIDLMMPFQYIFETDNVQQFFIDAFCRGNLVQPHFLNSRDILQKFIIVSLR